jgi:hypothetical protein
MANEVDFSGWVATEKNIELIKTNSKYRRAIHLERFKKAIKQRRWSYFTWFNIRGLLLNESKQF